MKPLLIGFTIYTINPAAFRRLCVETMDFSNFMSSGDPAAFRRLCVETNLVRPPILFAAPAAFRRLCVET